MLICKYEFLLIYIAFFFVLSATRRHETPPLLWSRRKSCRRTADVFKKWLGDLKGVVGFVCLTERKKQRDIEEKEMRLVFILEKRGC